MPVVCDGARGVRDVPHTMRWVASPASTRASVVRKCRQLGVILETPTDKTRRLLERSGRLRY